MMSAVAIMTDVDAFRHLLEVLPELFLHWLLGDIDPRHSGVARQRRRVYS
jgi:phosphatidylethanolamine-binding protein (PEBP) family uncharacterized protein